MWLLLIMILSCENEDVKSMDSTSSACHVEVHTYGKYSYVPNPHPKCWDKKDWIEFCKRVQCKEKENKNENDKD